MKPPEFLIEGYKRFRESEHAREVSKLAGGQAPKVMVIACSDSRLHPAAIFDADPGEIFMVRNVANIVPPREDDGHYHGTSAALEFAVNVLKIKYILVMGHSGCGGVRAVLAGAEDKHAGAFIGPWVGLMAKARDQLLKESPGAKPQDLQIRLEKANVRASLDNLKTFPFVRERLTQGSLTLLGAWFDIKSASLEWIE